MKREEAIKLLKQYQGYDPMFPDGETLKHAFDLTDETVDTLLTALRPVSREQVEKVWPGCRSCKSCRSCVFSVHAIKDMPCKKCDPNAEGVLTEYKPSNFCPVCGKPLTDEAVQMVMERLEALYGKAD